MDKATTRRGPTGKQTTFGGLVLAFVVALYTFAQPILNERLGWNLPALPQSSSPAVTEAKPSAVPKDNVQPDVIKRTEPRREVMVEAPQTNKTKTGPLAERASKSVPSKPAAPKPSSPVVSPTKAVPSPASSQTPAPSKTLTAPKKEVSSPATKPAPADDPKLLYGLLKDLGGERYVSPAGLLFTRGSAEGHRLDHLERHTVDDPQRPGKHGVFDGGMEGALATIDRAYERALTGAKTTKEVEEGRTIYTVDMGSRVGYIGGRDGNRQNKPMARRVKMVLDKDRVITAYPL